MTASKPVGLTPSGVPAAPAAPAATVGWWTKTARACAFAGLISMVACGPDQAPAAAHPSAQAVCPATPEETVGAACGVPGLRCGPQFTCGALSVSVLCTCTDGVFQCIDGAGNAVAAGATPSCPDAAPTAMCPPTEGSAQFASCTEPGLLCAYPSACPGRFDSCQCLAGQIPGGYGLRFECTPVACSTYDGGGAVADSGIAGDSTLGVDSQATLDAGGDARADAPGDGPAEAETSSADARAE